MYLYHTTAPLARVRPHKATCHKKRSGELTPVATDTQTPYRRASPQVTVSRPRRSALFRVQRQCCKFSRAERRALTCAAHIRSSYAPHHPLGGASEASSSAKGATAALAASMHDGTMVAASAHVAGSTAANSPLSPAVCKTCRRARYLQVRKAHAV